MCMGQSYISLNSVELDTIVEDFKQICSEMIFETKQIEGYSCKSEVIDKYVEIYRQIYELVSDYRLLLLHDLKTIIEVCDAIKKVDVDTSFMLNSHLMGGD